jgi:hypothetical protein
MSVETVSEERSIKTILTVLHGIASRVDSAYKVSEAEERKTPMTMVVVSPLSLMPTFT